MSHHECPSGAELARYLDGEVDLPLSQHIETCSHCQAELESFAGLSSLAQEAMTPELDPGVSDSIRAMLLTEANRESATPSKKTSWRWISVAIALAAAVMLVVWVTVPADQPSPNDSETAGDDAQDQSTDPEQIVSPTPAPERPEERVANDNTLPLVPLATIETRADAAWTTVSARPDERIALTTGTIEVEVTKLVAGERFRVVTADAEVEVRGTQFEVRANDNRLEYVAVTEGRVEVRYADSEPLFLGPGDTWTPPAATAVPTPTALLAPTPQPAPLVDQPVPGTAPERSPDEPRMRKKRRKQKTPKDQPSLAETPEVETPTPSPQAIHEAEFRAGWSAFQSGDYRGAISAFEKAISHGGSLREDAEFWLAVSLMRTDQSDRASAAFARFIERYPGSPRVHEASALMREIAE